MLTPKVILPDSLVFNRLVNRNNADLGKGVPRRHVFHEAWELLFFSVLRESSSASPRSALPHVHPCIGASKAEIPLLMRVSAPEKRGIVRRCRPSGNNIAAMEPRMRVQAWML